jgi:hypothetical protein
LRNFKSRHECSTVKSVLENENKGKKRERRDGQHMLELRKERKIMLQQGDARCDGIGIDKKKTRGEYELGDGIW